MREEQLQKGRPVTGDCCRGPGERGWWLESGVGCRGGEKVLPGMTPVVW